MSSIPNSEEIQAFIAAFSIASFGFIFYNLITNSPAFKLWESLSNSNVRPVMIQRLTGVFFFGLSTLAIIFIAFPSGLTSFGTALPNRSSLIWLLVLSGVIIPMNYFNSKSPENLQQYPQIRNSEWPVSLLILSALSWIAYLLAYEFLFRGFLLFSSVALLGVWPAILINTGLYSLVHIPKGSKETLGAIPFGIFLSYLAIQTGSFWIAFFAHVVLALSNEWFSLAAHKGMHVNFSRK